ncbi:MAG: hypothetical protein HC788_07025 [Sphingopyxis sp.]|nr:hypothetical protein [Sphingopyxis sp.]
MAADAKDQRGNSLAPKQEKFITPWARSCASASLNSSARLPITSSSPLGSVTVLLSARGKFIGAPVVIDGDGPFRSTR